MSLEELLRLIKFIYSATDFPLYETNLSHEEKMTIWNWCMFLSFEMNNPETAEDILEVQNWN